MIHAVLSIVLSLLFVVTGMGKVLGLSYANRQRELMHVSAAFWRTTGLLEWAGAIGLVAGIWFRPLGLLAGASLVLFMVAAGIARVRASRLSGSSKGLAAGVAADLVVGIIVAVDVVLIVANA